MADLVKTVAVLFNAEDNLSASVGSMEKKLGSFGSVANSIAAPLADAADMVLKVDAALTAFAVGGLAYAYTKSMQFETASVNLSKILGDQKDQIGLVEAEVLELSNKYGQAATSVMNSTTDFKRAGFEVQESLKLAEVGIGLVIGAAEAELGVAESTEIIISTLKGFQAPASEAARVTDILNTVSNEYATSVTQLGIGMSTLAPIAHQMGFSFEETAGILTPVIEIFRSGDEASTALKMGLLKLIDDAKPVRDALASIGVAQKDANGNLRSGRDIMMDVAEAFKTADEDEKLFLTTQLVGIRQAAKMVVVFDGLAKTTEITNRALASSGSISLEVAQKLLTAEVAVNRFKTGFENLGIAVGEQFRVAATGAINGGTEIENALQKIVEGGTFDPVFDALSDFGDDLGDFLSDVAKEMPEAFENVNFDDLLKALGSLGDSIGALFGDMDLTNAEDLEAAIQGAVDTITSLVEVTDGMVEAFNPVWDSIKSMVSGFNELDTETKKSSGNILASAKVVADAGLKIAAAIIVIGNDADKLAGAFKTVVNTITGTFNTALAAWKGITLVFANVIDELLKGSELFDSVFLFGKFGDDIAAARKDIEEWSRETTESMKKTAASALEDLTGITLGFEDAGRGAEGSAESIKKLGDQVGALPDQKAIDVQAELDAQAQEDLEWLTAELDGLGVLVVSPEVDEAAATKAIEAIEVVMEQVGTRADGSAIMIPVDADASRAAEKIAEIDNAIPTEKQIEIQLQGDIDERIAIIKGEFETIQTEIEWEAKLDIAEVQANAKIMEAAFDSVNVGIESTGDLIGSLFGSMESGASLMDKWDIERQIEKENKLREKSFELQKKLTDSQIEYNEAKTKALESGDVALTVQAEGLTPALEMIFHEVLKRAQIEANAEGLQMILGG